MEKAALCLIFVRVYGIIEARYIMKNGFEGKRQMEIREMTTEFSEASNIYAKSWKAAYRGIVPRAYLDRLTSESWTEAMRNSPFRNYIMKDGGVFVAASAIGKARDSEYEGCGEIVSIYVLPECFGKGYGTALFRFMTEKLRELGYDKMYLWVLKENFRARRFYEKMGFMPDGNERSILIEGKEIAEVCYTNQRG